MGDLQLGSSVGTVVGNDDDRGSVAEHLHPSTEAGSAMIFAGVAFVILLLTVGRGDGGLGKRALRVGEFILIVFAATVVANYAGRTFALLHSDKPGVVGASFNI